MIIVLNVKTALESHSLVKVIQDDTESLKTCLNSIYGKGGLKEKVDGNFTVNIISGGCTK